jgi:hypothetical protein
MAIKTSISMKPNHRTESVSTISLKIVAQGSRKGHFKVEQDEDDGDQVIAHIELHARVFESLEAALVRRELFAVRAMRRDHQTSHDGRNTKAMPISMKTNTGK